MTELSQKYCVNCSAPFAYRANKKFCSDTCRKKLYQTHDRQKHPVNSVSRPTVRRAQMEVFELAMRMAESLYTLPPCERERYLIELIHLAESGKCPKIKQVLTMPKFLHPDMSQRRLFWRKCPESYRTISQEADHVSRRIWGVSIVEFLHKCP